MALYDRIVNPNLLVRRLNVTASRVAREETVQSEPEFEQLNFFSAGEARDEAHAQRALEREKRRQRAVLDIRRKYGKNAIVMGMNLEEGATAMERNNQIGGHRK